MSVFQKIDPDQQLKDSGKASSDTVGNVNFQYEHVSETWMHDKRFDLLFLGNIDCQYRVQ